MFVSHQRPHEIWWWLDSWVFNVLLINCKLTRRFRIGNEFVERYTCCVFFIHIWKKTQQIMFFFTYLYLHLPVIGDDPVFVHQSSLCLSHIQPRAPYDFYHPYDFLPVKAEWSARRNLTSVLYSWSHQATDPLRLDTAVYLWFGWIIRMTPRVPRVMPIRAS